MNKIVTSLLYIIMLGLMCLTSNANNVNNANNVVTYIISRDYAYNNDLNNNTFLIWASNGTTVVNPMFNEVTLVNTQNSATLERIWLRKQTQFESWYWQMLKIKPNTPTGLYNVMLNNAVIGQIEVKSVTSRIEIQVTPKHSVASINYYFARGYNVTLTPGEYKITEQTGPIIVYPYTELRGFGAIVTGKSAYYRSALVGLHNNARVTGITFQPDAHTSSFDSCGAFVGLGVNNSASHVTVSDCTFKVGDFGIFTQPGLLVQRCKFDHSGAVVINGGTWIYNEFKGHWAAEHALSIAGATRLAVVECRFDETDRGPIIRGANSCLFAGLTLLNINKVNNGCELACIEGALPVNNNMFFGWRADNCVAGFSPFDAEFCDNLIYDMRINGPPWAFSFFGIRNQTGNVIAECHSDGGGLFFNHPPTLDGAGEVVSPNDKAKNNLVRDCGFINWRLTPGNQASGRKYYYSRTDLPNMAAVTDFAPTATNTCNGVTVSGEPAGRQKFFNLTVIP